jgi:hypothetical protein
MNRRTRAALGLVALCFCTSSYAEPRYKLNKQNTRVLEITNLSPAPGCRPLEMKARVVERGYDRSEARVTSVLVEDVRGERTLVNIDPVTVDGSNRETIAWVYDGLNKMLKKGRSVRIRIMACGAARQFLMLDAIRPG